MKWPLVWRSTFEECQHWRDAHRDKLAETLDAYQKQSADSALSYAQLDQECRLIGNELGNWKGAAWNLLAIDTPQALAKWIAAACDTARLAQMNAEEAAKHEERAEKRYADLLAKYQQLRLQGAVEHVPITPPPRAEPDACVRAINEKCRGLPPAVRTGMLAQLAADRAAQMSEVEILSRITNGVPADEAVTVA